MIEPGAIPQIEGDLEAVAAGGAQLKAQGRAVADTGTGVPERIDGRLDGAGEHCSLRGDAGRHRDHG